MASPSHADTGIKACVRCVAVVVAACLSSACAPPRRPPQFVPRDDVPLAGLAESRLGWPAADWWKAFGDPQLDHLVAEAMSASPDLQVAQARYDLALREADVQRAGLAPQVKGLADATHGYSDIEMHGADRPASAASSPGASPSSLFKPGSSWSNSGLAVIQARWDLDLWGKQKAALAAAVGQARAAEAEEAAARNSLQNSLVATYFQWQAIRARLAIASRSQSTAASYRRIIEARVHAGLDDPQQLDSADAQLAGQRRSVAMLAGSGKIAAAELAAIVGVSPLAPGDLRERPLPAVDTGLPADARLGLIARRPDIVAARWRIEASSRGIDEARAAYYPDIGLMALGGFLRAYPDLGSGTRTDVTLGSIGPSLSLPIYSGGRLKAQFESSQAQLDQAVAGYNRTVVQAARDVARQLLTLQQLDAAGAQQQREFEDSAARLRRTARQRQQGLIDDRSYLKARLQLDQQADARAQLKARRVNAELGLIDALGGGYRAASLPPLPTRHAAKDEPR